MTTIQSELNRIWQSLQTKNTTRASLFNLIFYTHKGPRTAYIRKIAQKVIEKFPARILFITADRASSDDFLKTEVSILTSTTGQFDVACDFIQVDASGPSVARTPFIVFPQILPDLPVYLVYANDPVSLDPAAVELFPFVDRIIFDSESTSDLSQFAKSLLEIKAKHTVDLADLNWARFETLRDLLAATSKQLQDLKSLEITYNAQPSAFFCHTRIQSVYLQAWLAAQLGWKLKASTFDGRHLNISYADQTVLLRPASLHNFPPGVILSFDITTRAKNSFSFARDLEQINQMTMRFCTETSCEVPTKWLFPQGESGYSLVKEIGHKGTSLHFTKVLQLLQTMEGSHLCS